MVTELSTKIMIVLLFSFLQFLLKCNSVVVDTQYGKVEGITKDNMNQFFGIPFAQPPVDELRFTAPQNPHKWGDSLLDAKGPPDTVPACMQSCSDLNPLNCPNLNIIQEDCLYLNIFTSSTAKQGKTAYTVLIWIHGGSFRCGWSASYQYDPTTIINNIGDVIIVTFNYRLGFFGFFYDNQFKTGLDGNYGFLDQMLAIQFVYKNIKYFGGNKNNIILWGHSSGAHLVALHLLYNNRLINGGIMESPSLWVPLRDPITWYNVPLDFSEHIGCNYSSDTVDLIKCWRSTEASKILTAGSELSTIDQWSWAKYQFFSPTVLTKLLPNQPLFEWQDKHTKTPPFIIGMNRDDTYINMNVEDLEMFSYQHLSSAINSIMNDSAVTNNILDFYGIKPDHSLTDYMLYDMMEISTDIMYCSIRNILNNLKCNMDHVYYYNFDVLNQNTNNIGVRYEQCINRVCHNTELLYLFLPPLLIDQFDTDTVKMGTQLQILWTNWAKSLNPNNIQSIHKTWPEYKNPFCDLQLDYNFLRILSNEQYIKQSTTASLSRQNTNIISSKNDLCLFWDKVGYLQGANIQQAKGAQNLPYINKIEHDKVPSRTTPYFRWIIGIAIIICSIGTIGYFLQIGSQTKNYKFKLVPQTDSELSS
eukprot:37313_1